MALTEAAARRLGFCLPFKEVDIDIAFLLPEQLQRYITREYLDDPRLRYDVRSMMEEDSWNEISRQRDAYWAAITSGPDAISLQECYVKDEAVLRAAQNKLGVGMKPGERRIAAVAEACGCKPRRPAGARVAHASAAAAVAGVVVPSPKADLQGEAGAIAGTDSGVESHTFVQQFKSP